MADTPTVDRTVLEKRAEEARAGAMQNLFLPRFAEEAQMLGWRPKNEADLQKAAQLGLKLLDARDRGLIQDNVEPDILDKMAASLDATMQQRPDIGQLIRQVSVKLADDASYRDMYQALTAVEA